MGGDICLTLSFNEKILLDKLIFLQYFHGEWLSVVSLSYEVDLAERTAANDREQLEIIK